MFKISLVHIGHDEHTRELIKRIASEEDYLIEEINANITTELAFSFSHNQIIILSLNMESIPENEELLLSVLNTFNSNPTIVVVNDYYLFEKSLELGCIGVVFRNQFYKRSRSLYNYIVIARELLFSRSLLSRNKNNYIIVDDMKYVCASDSTKKLIADAKKFAKTNEHILITGPTGTGKEGLGKMIHFYSNRSKSPYNNINLAATPEDLVASTLFGHKKGAFTGASGERVGIVEISNRGTLVIDEFGDISPEVQIMLLRLLENGEYYRIGDNEHKKVDVRIIATTKYSIKELGEKIREDLFYRFILHLNVLPLKDRQKDLAFLISDFMEIANKEHKKNCYLTTEARESLINYEYQGNIRELKKLIARAVILSERNEISEHEIDFSSRKFIDDNKITLSFEKLKKPIKIDLSNLGRAI